MTAEAFRHIRRKGSGVPYLTHLLSVAAMVGEHGGDEDQIIAALLHDYLEDIEGGSEAQLEAEFGPRVARLVRALSDTVTRPKPEWRERKIRYVEHLADEPADVKLICAADKLHNARSVVRDHRVLGDAIFSRFTANRAQTLWYYRAVLAALGRGFEHAILVELEETVAELYRVAGETFVPAEWPVEQPPANDL